MPKPPQARLVLNHSTHIEGLIKALTRLTQFPNIKTITPGRLSRTNSKPCPLRIKATVPITGGYKLQARSNRFAQEVFVITSLSKEDLQKNIEACIK